MIYGTDCYYKDEEKIQECAYCGIECDDDFCSMDCAKAYEND